MHRRRAPLSIILALVMALGVAMPSVASAATRAQLEAHRDKAEEARRKAAVAEATARRLAGEVAALDAQIESLQQQADAYDPKIQVASRRTDALRKEVAALGAQVAALQTQIDDTQAELDVQRELLAARAASAYKQGTWFYLDVLLGSQDFGDLITRTELVTRVIESNNEIAEGLGRTKDTLDKDKSKLNRSLQAVALKKREALAVENELRDLREEKQDAADKTESVQDKKSDLMADNKENAARLRALAEAEEAESARIAAELSGDGSGIFAGSMTWPVPSSHRVTSPYGWRICPFHGRELHPGIDVGRPYAGGPSLQGAAIVATAAGKVIYSGYRGGYGNTVMIDHGNGVVTLYAHQASGGIKVSDGQRVERGQRIGTVGSTGNSTGPHLHFEVRVNGEPKNPMGYF